MDIHRLLAQTLANGASDLHLSVGAKAMLRVDGDMVSAGGEGLEREDLEVAFNQLMTAAQRAEYKRYQELDFAYELANGARFRVNAFCQQRGPAAVLRAIPGEVKSLDNLHAPAVLKEIAQLQRGLVLVTGPTGSGKSTTLAAMVDYINAHYPQHILTIEDPVELVHQNKLSLVNQREVHRDTSSFAVALRAALREDPDVILVGELRDLETIRLALTAAETGHLVFATLHTTSAPKTIDRIVDVFPGDEKGMVRTMLSESLRAVISQLLVKRIDGGRVAAHEIMRVTPAIKNLIREDRVGQIASTMQTGAASGMQTMQQALASLQQRGEVAEALVQQMLERDIAGYSGSGRR